MRPENFWYQSWFITQEKLNDQNHKFNVIDIKKNIMQVLLIF